MKKSYIIGAVLLGCTVIGLTFWDSARQADLEEEDHHHHDDFIAFSEDLVKANRIEIQQASTGTLKQRVRAPAQISIVADKIAHILPKIGGIAVVANKNLGESVAKGEVLATLESKEMAEAKSAYLTAKKKETLTGSVYDRERSLYEKKLSSAEDFRNAESARDEALIELELSRQKLHAIGIPYNEIETLPQESSEAMRRYQLRSPIAGKVIARHITPGELLSSDSEVYIIADMSTVWAEMHVFANDRQYVKVGQPVAIVDHHGQTANTLVTYLSPVIDQETRTSTAIAELDNRSDVWLPGSFVQAEFVTSAIDVPLSIRKEAVHHIDGIDIVFVVKDNGFSVRPITIGQSDEECCEVLSGLESGESYASKNTFLLKADLKKDEAEHMD